MQDDRELVERFLGGDDKSFNQIARRYQKKIYWHALRMVGNHDDAMEVAQQVLLVVYEKLSTFKFNSSLSTWLYKITSTRSLNYLRKKKVKTFLGLESAAEKEDSKSDVFKSFDDKEKIERVINLLQKLPAKQREVFILKNFEEMTYKEIHEITGKTIGTLKANYFHALKKMMELTDEE